MSQPYRRSVITDEISQDLDRAIAVAVRFRLLGYSGWVALETHYRPTRTEADLRLPGGAAFSELGEAGTVACLEGWQRVLDGAVGALKQ